MSEKPKGMHHRIYLMDAKRDAREEGIYVLVSIAIATIAWLLEYRSISYLFLVGGGYFLLQVVGDLLAIRRHKHAMEPGASSELGQEGVDPEEVVRTISFGTSHPDIRVTFSQALEKTHAEGIRRFLDAIEGNKSEFLNRFETFKQLQCKHYPRYSEFIPDLEIKRMLLLPGDRSGKCRAMIWFSGELGEVWQADYEDGSFSELYSG